MVAEHLKRQNDPANSDARVTELTAALSILTERFNNLVIRVNAIDSGSEQSETGTTGVSITSPEVGSELTGRTQAFAFNDPDETEEWRYSTWFYDGETWVNGGPSVSQSPVLAYDIPNDGRALTFPIYRWKQGTTPELHGDGSGRPSDAHRIIQGNFIASGAQQTISSSRFYPEPGSTLTGSTLPLEVIAGAFPDGTRIDLRINDEDPGPSIQIPDRVWPYDLNVNADGGPVKVEAIIWNPEIGEEFPRDEDGEPLITETFYYTAALIETNGTVDRADPDYYVTKDLHKFSHPSVIAEGSMTETQWDQITNGTNNFFNGRQHASVVENAGSKWVRIKHPQGQISAAIGNMIVPRAQAYRTSFKLKFLTGFDFGGSDVGTQSGKLGIGVGMGRSDSGSLVSGGDVSSGGGTARLIWRGQTLKGYVYAQNRTTLLAGRDPAYGDEYPISGNNDAVANGVPIVIDQEHECVIDVVLNTEGNSDGVLRMWVDGVMIADRDDMMWMTGEPYSDRITWNSFHGGGQEWAPANDSYVLYRDMCVETLTGEVNGVVSSNSESLVTLNNNVAEGSLTDAVWDQMTDGNRASTTGETRASVIDKYGYKYLCVNHPKNEISGFNLARSLTPSRTKEIEFVVNFAEDFDFGDTNRSANADAIDRNHGKFGPGLSGGRGDLYGTTSGGDTGKDGFSCRLVWRGESDDSVSAKIYAYPNNRFFLVEENRDTGNPATDRAPGDEYPSFRPQFPRSMSAARIIRGQDHHCRMRVTVNTVDSNGQANADGSVQFWFDGQLIVDQGGLEWMNGDVNQPLVDNMTLSSFHGGGNSEYAPTVDSKVYYREIKENAVDGSVVSTQ